MGNVGSIDRALRIIVGIILLAVPLVQALAAPFAGIGGWVWVIAAVGAVLILTGFFRFCPAYRLLGIRT